MAVVVVVFVLLVMVVVVVAEFSVHSTQRMKNYKIVGGQKKYVLRQYMIWL